VSFGSNVVPWKPYIGVFWLKCSAIGGPDWYVYAQNILPWKPHIGVFGANVVPWKYLLYSVP